MLKKSERLTRNRDFVLTYQSNKFVVVDPITMHVTLQKDRHLGSPRVGFVVSKKVAKKACNRNKIKRRMRHTYKNLQIQHAQTLQHFYTIVFSVRKNHQGDVLYKDIYNCMDTCLRRSKQFIYQ